MSRTREARRIVQGTAFGLILVLCICFPGWVEHAVVDTPAGIYAEVSE